MTAARTVTVRVPGQLRQYCEGFASLPLAATSMGALLADIESRWPDLYKSVCNETGVVRQHVNLFVNASNVRDLEELDTALAPGDVVTILQAVSGG
jgi:sulfur-carrier protein